MSKDKPQLFFISEILFLGLAVICLLQWIDLGKNKAQLVRVSGRIAFIKKQYQNLDFHNEGLRRFVKLDDNAMIYSLEAPDTLATQSKVTAKNIDSLKVNDLISIYCGKSFLGADDSVSYATRYIDYQGTTIYKESQTKKKLFGAITMCCVMCIGALFWLKQEALIA